LAGVIIEPGGGSEEASRFGRSGNNIAGHADFARRWLR